MSDGEVSATSATDTRAERGVIEMLKAGVITDAVTANRPMVVVAESAGATADIRRQGGVPRVRGPELISAIIEVVSVPVMAKARIGHLVKTQPLWSLGVDYIDASEVLTPTDCASHVKKGSAQGALACGVQAWVAHQWKR